MLSLSLSTSCLISLQESLRCFAREYRWKKVSHLTSCDYHMTLACMTVDDHMTLLICSNTVITSAVVSTALGCGEEMCETSDLTLEQPIEIKLQHFGGIEFQVGLMFTKLSCVYATAHVCRAPHDQPPTKDPQIVFTYWLFPWSNPAGTAHQIAWYKLSNMHPNSRGPWWVHVTEIGHLPLENAEELPPPLLACSLAGWVYGWSPEESGYFGLEVWLYSTE